MGEIKSQFEGVYRDHAVQGVASSGINEPLKADIRALGGLIEQAIGTMGLGSSIDVTYPTRAALDADLAHGEGAVGLVYADAAAANNDLYVKSGASGGGSWTATTALHSIMDALGQPYLDGINALNEIVPNITPTSGEKLPVTSALFEEHNSATVILVGGRGVGMITPAGQTGATSFITPRIRFRRKEAKRLAGSTIRVRVAMTATVGYLAAT
ncbi:MAG: hypothetical protein COC10_07525, partial [Sphingobium sp.]